MPIRMMSRIASLLFFCTCHFLVACAVLAGAGMIDGARGSTPYAGAFGRVLSGLAAEEDIGLLRRGAVEGDAEAAQYVAWMYANGRGLPRNTRLAFEWYWRAVTLGAPRAIENARAALLHLPFSERRSVERDVLDVLFPGVPLERLVPSVPSVPVGANGPSSPAAAQNARVDSGPVDSVPVDGGPADSDMAAVALMVIEEAAETRVPPALALAVAMVESRLRPDAVSPQGARGVMQIMPATAEGEFGVDPDDLWDPRVNARLGVRFLDHLIARYGGIESALAHYNGGSRAAEWLRGNTSESIRRYVDLVMRYYRFYQAHGV